MFCNNFIQKKKQERWALFRAVHLRILLYHLINMYRQFDMVGQLVKTIFTELILINVPHLGLDNQITTLFHSWYVPVSGDVYFTVGVYQ